MNSGSSSASPALSWRSLPARGTVAVIALCLFLGQLLLTFPWLYRHGAGEPDSIAMATGTFQAMLKRTWFAESLYMVVGQPLYYGLFFAIPGAERLPYDSLATLMNVVSWLCSAGSIALLFLTARRFVSTASAAFASLILVSSPTMFEWSTFGHPVSVSLFLWLLSAFLFVMASESMSAADARFRVTPRGALLSMCAIAAGAASVLVRADVLILLGTFVVLGGFRAVAGNASKRDAIKAVAWAAVCSAAVAAAAMLLLAAMVPARSAGGASPVSGLLGLVRHFFVISSAFNGVLELLFAIGMVGTAIGAVAMARTLACRHWLLLLAAALLIGPPLIFAIGNPQPARRFLHPTFCADLILALMWETIPKSWRRLGPALGLAAVAGNLYLLPLAGRAMERAGVPVRDHSLLYRATASVLDHHDANQQYLEWIGSQTALLRAEATENSLILGSFADVNYMLASLSRDRIAANVATAESSYGRIISRIEAEGRSYYVCELHPKLAKPPDNTSFTRIMLMKPMDPADLDTTLPVTKLHPDSLKAYAMWYRPSL